MAREKGAGNLQREKSGRWTLRIGINGKRISRSTGTTSRREAERMLQRFLAPLGLGAVRIPLAEAWRHFEASPNRRESAPATLKSKRQIWMRFAQWLDRRHPEIGSLAEVTDAAVAEYLAEFKCRHSACTYNNHVCTLREVFRLLADKTDAADDPWRGVRLRADDSVSRRELSLEELDRLYAAASRKGAEWQLLFAVGIYTGLRLGDCCRLQWEHVDLERNVIQIVPAKIRRHARGRPVTIPLHPALGQLLAACHRERNPSAQEYVNPPIADAYLERKWKIDEALRQIFRTANVTMSVRAPGRVRKSVVASFHSLRHTFVSLSANAGAPLSAVQAIVGHASAAMTRHYYHDNETALRKAVAAIPPLGAAGDGAAAGCAEDARQPRSSDDPAARLERLEDLRRRRLIDDREYAAIRQRILAEL